MRATELKPTCNQKSFYGKAVVIIKNDVVYLKSYDTFVCGYDTKNQTFEKLWNSYSATTMKHINSFIDFCADLVSKNHGYTNGGKTWWNMLETKRKYPASILFRKD